MSTHSINVSIPVPSRRGLAVAVVAALIGAGIALAVVLGFGVGSHEQHAAGSGAKTLTAPRPALARGTGYSVRVPAGWRSLTAAELARVPGKPVAALQRTSGGAVVMIRRTTTPQTKSLKALAKSLNASYAKRFSDFKFVSARVQRLRSGPAFLYTFVRTKAGTAQSLVLASVGRANFSLDSAIPATDTRAATDVAAILRSFGP
jgi:hypothetical protein